MRKREYAAAHLHRGTDTYASRIHRLTLTKKPEPVTLGVWDTLTVSFGITPKGDNRGYQPHQTFIRFYDAVTGEEGIQPVRVGAAGKAKFELVSCSACYCVSKY